MTSRDFPQAIFPSKVVAPIVATQSTFQGDLKKKKSSLCEPFISGRYLATHVKTGGKKVLKSATTAGKPTASPAIGKTTAPQG